MTIVVNFFGGPGAAKSTMAADVFAELKWKGINCELVTEYAKDKVWEESFKVLDDQLGILGKQNHKVFRLDEKVDVIVSDAPIFNSIIYGDKLSNNFKGLVLELHNSYNNLNYFITREKPYNPKGRMQTEEEAKELDIFIKEKLNEYGIDYSYVAGRQDMVAVIAKEIIGILDVMNVVDGKVGDKNAK
ncbi:MAG TPA: AAA family ATPase [Pseudoneobacillus sp.]|nr:AAA family ATPase [Pseudoneobacillus sp.]